MQKIALVIPRYPEVSNLMATFSNQKFKFAIACLKNQHDHALRIVMEIMQLLRHYTHA